MMNYKKSKPVQIPSENLIVDPRSETSISDAQIKRATANARKVY
jgi:hypothetical protein